MEPVKILLIAILLFALFHIFKPLPECEFDDDDFVKNNPCVCNGDKVKTEIEDDEGETRYQCIKPPPSPCDLSCQCEKIEKKEDCNDKCKWNDNELCVPKEEEETENQGDPENQGGTQNQGGTDDNQGLYSWNPGIAVMCSSNDVGRGEDAVYRTMEENVLSWYPNKTVANSWDSDWRDNIKINCNGLSLGEDMGEKPPENTVVKCTRQQPFGDQNARFLYKDGKLKYIATQEELGKHAEDGRNTQEFSCHGLDFDETTNPCHQKDATSYCSERGFFNCHDYVQGCPECEYRITGCIPKS